VKVLTNRDGPRAPTAIHGHFGIKFHPLEKANAIVDCLKKRFTPHDLCEEDHKRQVEARVKDLKVVDINPLERIKPSDVQKLINTLKLREACGSDGIPNECLRQLPRRPLVHLTNLFYSLLSHFPKSWKDATIITLPKPGKDPKFPENLRPIKTIVHDWQTL
jgi:hypothetical protein